MRTTKSRVTLDAKEVSKAIEEYYNRAQGQLVFNGNLSVNQLSSMNNGRKESFGVHFDAKVLPGVDLTLPHSTQEGVYCKLRHKDSGLYLNSAQRNPQWYR